MMLSPRPAALAKATALALLTALGTTGCDALSAHKDVVARAGGESLAVDQAARLLASNPQIPADPAMVTRLADLWVDYTLLAKAAAEDSTLSKLDLEPLIQPERESRIIRMYHDKTVPKADTVFTDQELQQRWNQEGAGAEIRARHILIQVQGTAPEAERTRARQQATQLQARAAKGEDFAALARQFSADPGSKAQGGDLGFFGRGQMVAPFEEAAFKLQPGQVSGVVETPFGFHIIKLEERRQPELGAQRDQFRQYLVRRAQSDADSIFIDSLAKTNGVKLADNAVQAVRDLASAPNMEVGMRAGRRELATYNGGELRVTEMADLLRLQPQISTQIASAPDPQLSDFVRQLTIREVLLREAQKGGVTLPKPQADSLQTQARAALQQLLAVTGFNAPAPEGANSTTTRVEAYLREAIAGRRQVVPLGPLGSVLRKEYKSEINSDSFAAVVARMQQLRPAAPAGAPGAPGAPGTPPGQIQVPVQPQGQQPPPATPAP